MGILCKTVSISQFRVIGNTNDILGTVEEYLATRAFQCIDEGSDETSLGWVTFDDSSVNDFSTPEAVRRDHYLAFGLRKDERKIAASLLRRYLDQAHKDFLSRHPGLNRVPKSKKEEIREQVRGLLLNKTLPVSTIIDAVWNTDNQVLTIASLNNKAVELFESLFKATFEGLRIAPITPFARAQHVVPEHLLQELQSFNKARSDNVLAQIEDNQWLGRDLLLWLVHQTMNASSEYVVSQPGPIGKGAGFVAYINDKICLQGADDNGPQKVTVSGFQDRFEEVQTALKNGKTISEATIFFEYNDSVWKVTLKGKHFHFASLTSPAIKLEVEDLADGHTENLAVFYERMGLLETVMQLFDSLLSSYLEQRLSQDWAQTRQRAVGA